MYKNIKKYQSNLGDYITSNYNSWSQELVEVSYSNSIINSIVFWDLKGKYYLMDASYFDSIDSFAFEIGIRYNFK